VKLSSGEVISSKHIVVSCGSSSDSLYEMKNQFEMASHPTETYVLKNGEGLPAAFMMSALPGVTKYEVNGLCDGDDMKQYKIGYKIYGAVDSAASLGVFKKLFPTKIKDIISAQPCNYAVTPGGEFIFEKHNKVVYACGLGGAGFKHLPYHGKRICHLINDDLKEGHKYKMAAKL